MQKQEIVTRDGNNISFNGSVTARAHRKFLSCLHDSCMEGHDDIQLDFANCTMAFMDGMIPLLATADALRRKRIKVTITLPKERWVNSLFKKSNWAHILAPSQHKQIDRDRYLGDSTHLPARRFATPTEQQQLVNTIMDIVISREVLKRDLIAGFDWSINEITDNVLNHAKCDAGGIVQVSVSPTHIVFGVADAGRGILASLREGHTHLKTDTEAISEAIREGVTRNTDEGQGNGLWGALSIAMKSSGRFEIISGSGNVVVTPNNSTIHERKHNEYFFGTSICASFDTRTEFDVSDALRLRFSEDPQYRPYDIIEAKYEKEDAYVLKVCDDPNGYRSRSAGRAIRTTCRNLLNSTPLLPLIIDWDGINMVPSSFADELVAKLYQNVGPDTFKERVSNNNMTQNVRNIVAKALQQRVNSAKVINIRVVP